MTKVGRPPDRTTRPNRHLRYAPLSDRELVAFGLYGAFMKIHRFPALEFICADNYFGGMVEQRRIKKIVPTNSHFDCFWEPDMERLQKADWVADHTFAGVGR
jgi:hypothetical protein